MDFKITTNLSFLFISFFLLLSSCDLFTSISESGEDSGFEVYVINRSEIEYKGISFYMGTLDKNNKFVAIDSLHYPELVIHRKGEGNNVDEVTGYSKTYPFQFDNTGLDENDVWTPDIERIKEVSSNNKVNFKVKLDNRTSISTSSVSLFNGTAVLVIMENNSLVW